MVIDSINPLKTAVIVVDMLNDFIAPGAPMEVPMGTKFAPKLGNFLESCRDKGIFVIYAAHVHKEDGSDMGRFEDIYEPIKTRQALVDGSDGVDIYPEVYPKKGEHVIKKHRYSAFYDTEMDMILRERQTDTVVVVGVTTEDCCHATARDAMFRGYKVAFLSDLTGTYDYPDTGFGEVSAEEVHRVTLAILGVSTAHVMTSEQFSKLLK